MIVKQFFDEVSSTYTYLLAQRSGGEALIIDSVLENTDEYLRYLGNHQLKLAKVVDTHTHADHKSAMARLRNLTACMTVVSDYSPVTKASVRVTHGDRIQIPGISLKVLHTPGHTADSCCFYMPGFVFTGDTLLISSTGRTDFQGGDAGASYDSIVGRLFTLPGETVVYPGHDYKGENLSTIAIEVDTNPRLAGQSREEYITTMSNLKLADPAMMDVAIPANISVGDDIGMELDDRKVLSVDEARAKVKNSDVLFVDLRDNEEIEKTGTIEGCLRIPYRNLDDVLLDIEHPLLQHLAEGKEVVFFCAFGERSALALSRIGEAHIGNCYHLRDGMDGWLKVH
jgi:glyoxylase-like metal-dependent hydrolase (beta-lactamase superfamily II)/rhodanese-related sulfurtransferase